MSSLYPPRALPAIPKRTEFDVLKSSHKFLREDEEDDTKLTWDDRVAKKYYENLYREYAVVDLKHYKSGNFALRWRTENEVLSGAGETTCGNTRCEHHPREDTTVTLQALELPFAYTENEETKSALVKVVLCKKCVKKLMWKRTKEKEERERETRQRAGGLNGLVKGGGSQGRPSVKTEEEEESDRVRTALLASRRSPGPSRNRGVKEEDIDLSLTQDRRRSHDSYNIRRDSDRTRDREPGRRRDRSARSQSPVRASHRPSSRHHRSHRRDS